MADLILDDGREIDFDLRRLTIKEYRELFKPEQPEAEEYATIAKVTGLTAKEVEDLPLLEWKKVYRAFLRKCAEPLADPN